MSRTVLRLSLSVVGVLVAGTLAAGSATAATAAGEDGDCAGMTAPAAPSGTPARPVTVADTASVVAGGTVVIHVLANDPAPASPLSVVYTSTPSSGGTCIDSSGAVEYFADQGSVNRTDSFTYAVTDGYHFVQQTVTVTVKGVVGVNATVLRKARNGKKARLSFTNGNDYPVVLPAGAPNKRRPDLQRTIAPHASTVITSRRPKLFYVVTLTDPSGNEIPVSFGTVRTATGKVRGGNYADQRIRALAHRWSA